LESENNNLIINKNLINETVYAKLCVNGLTLSSV